MTINGGLPDRSSSTVRSEVYTPGHSSIATEFMARRSLKSHGEFLLPHLKAGQTVLDCGCGPGTITLGIATRIAGGSVIGIDFNESQIARATAAAGSQGVNNATFHVCNCNTLDFPDGAFDLALSHALLEHMAEPMRVLRELYRVLKPSGVIAVCSPDWGGFILAPPSPELSEAVTAYTNLQSRNGGDVLIGRHLGVFLAASGFTDCRMSARYEVYPSARLIGEYLAHQLDADGDRRSADTFRNWSREPCGMFAQCWVSCVARKPDDN